MTKKKSGQICCGSLYMRDESDDEACELDKSRLDMVLDFGDQSRFLAARGAAH